MMCVQYPFIRNRRRQALILCDINAPDVHLVSRAIALVNIITIFYRTDLLLNGKSFEMIHTSYRNSFEFRLLKSYNTGVHDIIVKVIRYNL